MTLERWLTIPGHEKYEASDLGRIRRALPGRGARVGRVLKPSSARGKKARGRYFKVALTPIGSQYVHKLIAQTFLGEAPRDAVARFGVHHKDGDWRNNAADNLKYVSQEENIRDEMARHMWGRR